MALKEDDQIHFQGEVGEEDQDLSGIFHAGSHNDLFASMDLIVSIPTDFLKIHQLLLKINQEIATRTDSQSVGHFIEVPPPLLRMVNKHRCLTVLALQLHLF